MSEFLTTTHLKALITEQEEKIKHLEKRVAAAERQAEAAEQYSRLDCLILRGRLDIRPNRNLRDEVMRLIAFHTGVQFPSWCLNTVHWLGGGNSLIVRFNNKQVRDDVYKNRVPKEAEKRGLFIHESLTPSKMALVAKCAVMRKQGTITTYYTQGGNVMVKRQKDTPSMMLSPGMSERDILEMLHNQPTSYKDAATRGVERAGEREMAVSGATSARTAETETKKADERHIKNTTEEKEVSEGKKQVQTQEVEKAAGPSSAEKEAGATQERKTSQVREESEKEEESADATSVDGDEEKQIEDQSQKVKTVNGKGDEQRKTQDVVAEMPEASGSTAAGAVREEVSTEADESPSKSPSKQRKSKRRRNLQKRK